MWLSRTGYATLGLPLAVSSPRGPCARGQGERKALGLALATSFLPCLNFGSEIDALVVTWRRSTCHERLPWYLPGCAALQAASCQLPTRSVLAFARVTDT